METLLVENDCKIEEFVILAFQVGWPGSRVIVVHKGEESMQALGQKTPDLIIIEPERLTDIDGFDLIKEIRLFSDAPILIITEKGDETTIIKGLEQGADEYIIKPVSSLVLLARIRALMRRQWQHNNDFPVIYGKFCLYPTSGDLFYDKYKINLTRTESLILRKLMKNPGRVITCTNLAQIIWGEEYPDSTTSIRSHIKRLRAKLEKVKELRGELIHTKSGIGYSLSQYN